MLLGGPSVEERGVIAYAVKYAEHSAPIAAYGFRTCADVVGPSMIENVIARLSAPAVVGEQWREQRFDRLDHRARSGAHARLSIPTESAVAVFGRRAARAGWTVDDSRRDPPASRGAARARLDSGIARAVVGRTAHAHCGDGGRDRDAVTSRARAVGSARRLHLERVARASHSVVADPALCRNAQPRSSAHRTGTPRGDRRHRAGRASIDASRGKHSPLFARRASDVPTWTRAARSESRRRVDRRRLAAARQCRRRARPARNSRPMSTRWPIAVRCVKWCSTCSTTP